MKCGDDFILLVFTSIFDVMLFLVAGYTRKDTCDNSHKNSGEEY